MNRFSNNIRQSPNIAFIGNYLPRQCGIATFTYDLAEAVVKESSPNQNVMVAAMNDRAQGYDYPDRVKLEIDQESLFDYQRTADLLNFSNIDVISLQHEYGIFGGDRGSHILTLLDELHQPVVVTCHTVHQQPDPKKKEILKEIAAKANKLVVMSRKAVEILENIYHVPRGKIVHIPHGIHSTPFIDSGYYKSMLGLEGRQVLMTFGLLHRNKGIEYMIEAMPAIVEKNPRVMYVVLGATHPKVLQKEGQSYRHYLEKRVQELGLKNHVIFKNRFVELNELLQYLGATDILVTPYTKLDQITSGVLPYAMGMGRAVVSTPYWHAEELLADGRGRLVPVCNSEALANEINGLFDNRGTLSTVCQKAYNYSRNMVWSAVAHTYLKLFSEIWTSVPQMASPALSMPRPFSATELFQLKDSHLENIPFQKPPLSNTAATSARGQRIRRHP